MRLVLVATGLAAISLSACGKAEERSPQPANEVMKDGPGATVSGKTDTSAKPPAFAPLYPGAKVESAPGIGNDKADGGAMVYTVAATPKAVVGFYKQKAAASGFKTEMDSDMGAAHMFAASDVASGKALQVIASAADGGTSVQVVWATRK